MVLVPRWTSRDPKVQDIYLGRWLWFDRKANFCIMLLISIIITNNMSYPSNPGFLPAVPNFFSIFTAANQAYRDTHRSWLGELPCTVCHMIPCIFTHEEFITFFIRYSEPLVLREEQTNYLLSISSVTSMKKYRKITSGILGRNTVILLAFQ